MAFVYITEGQSGSSAGMQVMRHPIVTRQQVAIGGSSAPFTGDTKLIRVNVDATCSIVIGPSPTATTADLRMVQNQTEYFEVRAGDQLASIANS